jgi:Conserved hypothetical protein 2217 (DUF2460)
MVDTFDFPYKRAYVASAEFNTIVDTTFTGGEQRRGVWTDPMKSWSLDFEKTEVDWNSVLSFFISQQGRLTAFNWVWDSTKGGDGNTYLVRFASDSLDLSVLEMGYSTFSIKLMQVQS